MNRFNGSAPVAPVYKISDLELHTWFERDRACVELRSPNGETVFEAWDEDCLQLIEYGYLDPKDFKQSAFDYAQELGLIA